MNPQRTRREFLAEVGRGHALPECAHGHGQGRSALAPRLLLALREHDGDVRRCQLFVDERQRLVRDAREPRSFDGRVRSVRCAAPEGGTRTSGSSARGAVPHGEHARGRAVQDLLGGAAEERAGEPVSAGVGGGGGRPAANEQAGYDEEPF